MSLHLQATGRPGWQLDPTLARLLRARKREAEVTVEFATAPGWLQTLEGEVQVKTGDALVTGLQGERWRVSAGHFAARYRPAATPGRFISRPTEVRAMRLAEPCTVVLSDGASILQGGPGDWLLDYGDGSLGLVAASIFDLTYEIL